MKISLHFLAADAAAGGPDRGRLVQAATGISLMRAALDAGIDGIAADCGGALSCGTCHVVLSAAWAARLPPADAEEQAMLDFVAMPRQPHSRLSCQVVLADRHDGLTVVLPTTQY
ncbi:MAG: 2Fe-2S iron-sulfur cluster-binding protein [Aquabacterium sp.]